MKDDVKDDVKEDDKDRELKEFEFNNKIILEKTKEIKRKRSTLDENESFSDVVFNSTEKDDKMNETNDNLINLNIDQNQFTKVEFKYDKINNQRTDLKANANQSCINSD